MKSLIITGPSGVGKGTFIQYLLSRYNKLSLALSFTTRKPRPHEINGIHYIFVTMQQFQYHRQHHNLLQQVQMYGNFYGTNYLHIKQLLKNKKIPVLDVDADGVQTITKNISKIQNKGFSSQCLCLMPPSWETLENRLRGRQSQNQEQIIKRLKQNKRQLQLLNNLQKQKFIYYVTNFQYQLTAFAVSNWLKNKFPQIQNDKQ